VYEFRPVREWIMRVVANWIAIIQFVLVIRHSGFLST
jgi:hypothetical protein